jgi:tetratricopeptide (TPR) repeat protein
MDEIGRGGMGVVYRARDIALERDVAVKLLSQRFPADSLPAQRFLSEARITGKLEHPGIPAVHQVGTLADGRHFLAMKLIKGSTLESILEHRPDPAADRGRLLATFETVCQAVGYAHAHRVIHRDLKPANVMVGAFGEVQVMDWGLAKVLGDDRSATALTFAEEPTLASAQNGSTPQGGSATQAGSMVGTPAFMPPEQAIGQIDRVNERSDVFGLGAILAVILTGKPPYAGETAEAVRVQAVRGELKDCFARLDTCGAEPELAALCKKCLAFELADRPADAGAVAHAVGGLRTAADERARRAELERVRVQGEQATTQARLAERRKRWRLALGAAAVLALAAVGGLLAVLHVQRQGNAELAEKNTALADEQAKVEARNQELAAEQAKVQARFELAQKAIALFHTGVSEDALLKNGQFNELRTKLLKEAAGFYADLQKLLKGQTDAKSRQALAAAYFQLAELTGMIGEQRQALAVHRQALDLRRELAEGANPETQLDVARSLGAEGHVLWRTGNLTGALQALEEQRDIAAALEAKSASDAVRAVLALSHSSIGVVLMDKGKPAAALEEYQKALAIRQKLADANPTVAEFQGAVAQSHQDIAMVLRQTGKLEEALTALRQALAIQQKLADTEPAYQLDLARSHSGIGGLLQETGKPAEALQTHRKALAIFRKLADANPAVNELQDRLAGSYHNNAVVLMDLRKPDAAVQAHQKALAILQKLADANPTVTAFQTGLSSNYDGIGWCLLRMGKAVESAEASGKALALCRKLLDDNPANTQFRFGVANLQTNIGRALDCQKRWAEALTALDEGLVIRENLAKAYPNNAFCSRALAESHTFRGAARVRAGQPAEAVADLRLALELWAKEPATHPEMRLDQSRALALLAGLGEDAKSGVTKDEASRFAHQSVATLADVVKTGWVLPSELNEPNFDAVRSRSDFGKLVAEVEAKAAKD